MKILMTNNALKLRGGSESYLETVSWELRRLGHEVTFFSPRCGDTATRLRSNGFEVFEAVEDLPRAFDVIHGQHVNAVGTVRTRLPSVPLVFATHSWFINALEDPVPELGATAYLAFNEITRRRLEAHVATRGAAIHRLTQPVEISHADAASVPIAATPRRAVAVSRRMSLLPSRLAKVCADQGIEFGWVGGPGRDSVDPRQEIFTADIVVGMGRTALEAMAAGRAVLVADEGNIGGWIGWPTYSTLEADGFTGRLGDVGAEGDLESLLGQYSEMLGSTARTLAVRHHAAQQHAVRLVEIYSSVADTSGEVRSTQTVARLADERYALEQRAVRGEWAAAARRRELDVVRSELDEARQGPGGELDAVRSELADVRRELGRVRAKLDVLRARRATLRQQRDRLRGQRNRLRRERDEARRSLGRLEGLLLVRLARRVKRGLGRFGSARR
jgi:hypothetical protein